MNKSGLSANVLITIAAIALSAPILASCQSAPPEEPLVQSRQPTAQVVGPQAVNTAPVSQLRNTNTFPTFDGKLTAAGEQMTDEEASDMERSLTGLASARGRGAITEAEYKRRVQELRDIGASPQP